MSLLRRLWDWINHEETISETAIATAIASERVRHDRLMLPAHDEDVIRRMRQREEKGKFLRKARQ